MQMAHLNMRSSQGNASSTLEIIGKQLLIHVPVKVGGVTDNVGRIGSAKMTS